MQSQDVHFEINSLIQQLETASSKEDLNMHGIQFILPGIRFRTNNLCP